jgi:uncharacterized protein
LEGMGVVQELSKSEVDKKERLIANLKKMKSVLVAFSGGVDSAFLLAAAREALGSDVLAVTAASPIHPVWERTEATAFAKALSIPHLLISSREMDLPEFVANSPERCYHCKKALCKRLKEIARERDIPHVLHGANVDDLNDFRPGFRAAVEEEIKAPLMDVSLTKSEIRRLSKALGLPLWDKPSMACLATRIPYGSAITEEKLGMIGAAETYLRDKGLKTLRVRHHGGLARIEAGHGEGALILEDVNRKDIVKKLRHMGFDYIALDLEEFTSGKMNRSIKKRDS